MRRYTTLGSLETKENVFRTGGLEIDDESKRVTVDGEEVKLTPVQYKILKLLTANAGRVYSIEEIYEKVWQEDAINRKNTVAVHIRKIREKIEINPKEPKYLKVVWGLDTKWKEFSHSLLTKIIVFMIVLFCFSNALTVFLTMVEVYNADLS